jgi:epoxyqueuosine reductase QueG
MITEIIKSYLKPSENFVFGFAQLRGLLDEEFKEYPYGISLCKRLDDHIVDAIENGPTLEYLKHYKEINIELQGIADKIASDLSVENVKCIAIVPTISTSSEEFKPYLKDLKYKISHKMVATRAGLGWIGKTDLFVSKDFGPRVRLVSLLINTPLDVLDKPIDASRCGKCNICVSKCPAQAANGKLWDICTTREAFFEVEKCREKCQEIAKKMLDSDAHICGICVSVCPIGKSYKRVNSHQLPVTRII